LYMPVRDSSKDAASVAGYPFWPIVLCGLIVLVAFMTEATVETWSALHIERTLGGHAAEGAMGPAMLGITMAVGRFSGQAVSQMFSDTKVIILATLVAATGAVFAALAPTPFWAYVGFGILGIGVSVIGPLGLALVGKSVPTHLRTEAISRVAVIGFSGFFLAPTLMGMVSEFHGLRVAFLCASALSLMVIPLILLLRRL
jgi:MFS family permease